MTSEEIRLLIISAIEWGYEIGTEHQYNGSTGGSSLSDVIDVYLNREDIKSAIHSVEAEKEPDAYMDSWEYRDFQKRGSGTVFSSAKHMGKAVPFYLNPPEHKPE